MKTKIRRRVQWSTDKESRTQQHLKQESDVNSILEKYKRGIPITHVNNSKPLTGDFSQYQDFKTNKDLVVKTFNQFMALPAHLRKRFGNDPENLIDFVSDDQNYDEAIKLGLVPPKPEKPKTPQNDDKTTIKEHSNTPAT